MAEDGSDLADELWDAADLKISSHLIYPEARAALVEEHALRGYDAVHLATALSVKDPALVVVTWDAGLAGGALRCGRYVAPALAV